MFASRRVVLFVASALFGHRCLFTDRCATAFDWSCGRRTPASPVVPGPTAPALTDVRAQNAEQLRLAQRKLEANGAADKAAAHEVAYLQTRDAILAQRAAVEQQIKDLNSRKERIESQLKSPQAPDKPPTFADLDRMKDDLSTAQAKAALLADKLETATRTRTERKLRSTRARSNAARPRAAYESGKSGPKAAELSAAADRARHDVELATETLTLRKSELARGQLAKEVQQLSVKLLQDKVERTSPLVTFSEADYQQQIDDIKKIQETTKNSLSRAESDMRSTEVEMAELKKQLEAAAGADRALITEKLGAQWRTRQRASEELESLSQQMQQLSQLQQAWTWRYELASVKRDPNDQDVYQQLKSQQKETRRVLEELSSGLRIQILTMKNLRGDLTSVAKKANDAAKGPAEILSYIQEQQSQLEETLRINDQRIVSIETARRVHEKLLDELNENLKALTPKSIALDAWYQFEQVWNYWYIPTEKGPITVGMSILALTTLALGWMLSRFVSVLVAYRVLKRFHLSKDATSAIRSLVFYCMLIGVVLEAMHMVQHRPDGIYDPRRCTRDRRRLWQPGAHQQFHRRPDHAGRAAGAARRTDHIRRNGRHCGRRRLPLHEVADQLRPLADDSEFHARQRVDRKHRPAAHDSPQTDHRGDVQHYPRLPWRPLSMRFATFSKRKRFASGSIRSSASKNSRRRCFSASSRPRA